MSYKHFQKKHPSWPGRLREVLGRKVVLKRDIVTRGGSKFEAGAVMVVESTHRGTLALRRDGAPYNYGVVGNHVRQVWCSDVELLGAEKG